MQISRVKSYLIDTKRLDPDYYEPQYLEDEQLLRSFAYDFLGNAGKMFAGPFGSELPSNLYLDKGIPLFRVGNVGTMEVNFSGMAHLEVNVHKKLSASEVIPGDLLIVKASVGEKICKIPSSLPQANITQHIIALRSNGKSDIDYIAAFLYGKFGKRQLVRRSLGSIVQYLGVNDARTVVIPKIELKAQTYIGDKVRWAEQLRERARGLEEYVWGYNNKLIPSQENFNFTQRTRRVLRNYLTDRLDAHYYPPVVESYLRQIPNKKVALGKLCEVIFSGETKNVTSSDETGVWQATVTNLSSSFLKDPYRWVDIPNSQNKYLQAHDLLLCNAAHSKDYIGRQITYFQGNVRIFPSTELMVVRVNRNMVPASYIRCYLLTKIGYKQIQSTIRGISAHTYPADTKLLSIPLPEIDDVEKASWFSNDEKMLMAGKYHDFSFLLTTTAKLLVEALIEGKITEAELINAQEALEKGDIDPDWKIMSRLTRKGIDVKDEPSMFLSAYLLYDAVGKWDIAKGEDV